MTCILNLNKDPKVRFDLFWVAGHSVHDIVQSTLLEENGLRMGLLTILKKVRLRRWAWLRLDWLERGSQRRPFAHSHFSPLARCAVFALTDQTERKGGPDPDCTYGNSVLITYSLDCAGALSY